MAGPSRTRMSAGSAAAAAGAKSSKMTQVPFLSSTRRTSSNVAYTLAKAAISSHMDDLDDDDGNNGTDTDNNSNGSKSGDSNNKRYDTEKMDDQDEPLSEQDQHGRGLNNQSQLDPTNASFTPSLASVLKDTRNKGIKLKAASEKDDPTDTTERVEGQHGASQVRSMSTSAIKPVSPIATVTSTSRMVIRSMTSPDLAFQHPPGSVPRRKPLPPVPLTETKVFSHTNADPPRKSALKRNPLHTVADTEAKISSHTNTSPLSSTPTKAATKVNPAAAAKPNPLAPTPAAPYGYKIVKVKKSDGTVVKVKRALKEGETPPKDITTKSTSNSKKSGAAAEKPSDVAPNKSVTAQKEVTTAPPKKKPVTDASAPSDVNGRERKPSRIAFSGTNADLVMTADNATQINKPFRYDTQKFPENDRSAQREVQVNEKELEKAETSPMVDRDPELEAQLKHSQRVARSGKIFVWSLAVLFPLFFIVLGVVTALSDGHIVPQNYFSAKSVEDGRNDPLSEAITVAASVWPIVFAAVVAQSLKMCAAYKVERGIKLMTLEQLTSSHSVGGALKQPFLLRTFNWTSIGLLFLWALSPLAGQAILRMSLRVSIPEWNNDTDVSYYSTITAINNGSSYTVNYNLWGIPLGTLYGGPINYTYQVEFSLLTALMQGYSQGYVSGQDIYTNVKIPLFGKISDTFDFYNATSGELYSSLLGYPFWIYDQDYDQQTTNFTVSSRYYALNCSEPIVVNPNADILDAHNLSLDVNSSRTFDVTAMNNTQSPFLGNVYWNGSDYVLYDNTTSTRPANISTTYKQPGPSGTMYIASLRTATINEDDDIEISQVLYAECPYRSVHLNTSVTCIGVEQNSWCVVTNQTEVQSETNSTAAPLGYWFPSVLQQMTNERDTFFSQLEQFLNNPQYASTTLRNTSESPNSTTVTNLNNITSTQLSERLGLVLNALWALGFGPPGYFTGPDLQSWQTYSFPFQNITAYVDEEPSQRYFVLWGWIVCLIVCSVLLTVAAVAAAIFETRTVGPQFLGFANTAIKKSVKTPRNMSNMNARDRLLMLQECEVMLHDAKPKSAIGKIQLGVKEEGHVRLVKTRQYI